MGDQPAQEREIRRQASDLRLGERVPQPEQGLVARRAVRDQLGDHRVVGDSDLVAFLDAGIDPDPRRQAQTLDPAGLGEKRPRILGVEPHLDGMTRRRCVEVQALAGGDAKLLFDEVDARHELGHRVLDLDPPVQLEEVEVARRRA